MKKKVMVLFTALTLLFATMTALPAMAAGSPVIGVGEVGVPGSKVPENAKLVSAQVSAPIVSAMRDEAKRLTLSGTVVATFDISMVDKTTNAPIAPDANTKIVWSMPEVRYYDSVILLHLKADGTYDVWYPSVHDGFIEFTPTGFSPVAVIYAPGTAPVAAGTKAGTTATAPKTGVND